MYTGHQQTMDYLENEISLAEVYHFFFCAHTCVWLGEKRCGTLGNGIGHATITVDQHRLRPHVAGSFQQLFTLSSSSVEEAGMLACLLIDGRKIL